MPKYDVNKVAKYIKLYTSGLICMLAYPQNEKYVSRTGGLMHE